MPIALPVSVRLPHFRRAGIQVEDQLIQSAALVSAINPLPRHVHQGLQVLLGSSESPSRIAHLPAGRQVSLVDAACLSFARPPIARGIALSARAHNRCGWCENPFSHPHPRESPAASSAFANRACPAGKDSRMRGDEMGISSQHCGNLVPAFRPVDTGGQAASGTRPLNSGNRSDPHFRAWRYTSS